MDVVITCFDLHACGASQPAVHVVDGDLHIVCGSKAKVLGLATRQRIVKQLRDELRSAKHHNGTCQSYVSLWATTIYRLRRQYRQSDSNKKHWDNAALNSLPRRERTSSTVNRSITRTDSCKRLLAASGIWISL